MMQLEIHLRLSAVWYTISVSGAGADGAASQVMQLLSSCLAADPVDIHCPTAVCTGFCLQDTHSVQVVQGSA
jgi:hypothetical protein